MTDVCLVSMPYSAIERPSIALGILQACLRKTDIDVMTMYGNLLFAEQVGLDAYSIIDSSSNEELMGEWTFSGCAFPEFSPNHEAFFGLLEYRSDALINLLWKMRAQAKLFVNKLAHIIVDRRPRIVGCTSTFQQNCASLALLRRIKAIAPEITTMMGGANCESTMGMTLRREFPWVDYVVSGEADELIGDFCHLLLEHEGTPDPSQLPHGVIGASEKRHSRSLSVIRETQAPRAVVKNLQNSPIPSYDDYFEVLARSPLQRFISPGLLIETSRGCWWGQKHHCTFCGLNDQGLGYRSKKPDQVLEELTTLADRYELRKILAVDDILNLGFMDTVLLQLSHLEERYTLFFETKANLKRAQVQRLAEAGITWVQPGIESLHDDFLKLIDKGTTSLINLQLMKWCREYGIYVTWNFLTHAPGERDEWYAEMSQWLPLIVHFLPPQGAVKIRYDRFSPYFMQAENYGIRLTPLKGYAYIYPVSASALFDLVYFFEDGNDEDARQMGLHEKQTRPWLYEFRTQVEQWVQIFWKQSPPVLSMADNRNSLCITDTRPCATQETHLLEGLFCEIYRACDGAMTMKALLEELQATHPGITWEDIALIVEQLKQDKLLLESSGRFFSLAIRETAPALPQGKDFPGGSLDINAFISCR